MLPPGTWLAPGEITQRQRKDTNAAEPSRVVVARSAPQTAKAEASGFVHWSMIARLE